MMQKSFFFNLFFAHLARGKFEMYTILVKEKPKAKILTKKKT